MIGTHQGPMHFTCPYCHARPTKPCVHPTGPRTGKTTRMHDHRRAAYEAARNRHKDPVIWTNAVETNRERH